VLRVSLTDGVYVCVCCMPVQTHEGDMRLVSVYVPTNHVYVGECVGLVHECEYRKPS